jgi:hypothetical protein
MYGFRPCSSGNGQTTHVEMASPMYSLLTVSQNQNLQRRHLHNVAKDGDMALVCEIVLNAWYLTCLRYVRCQRSFIRTDNLHRLR